MVVGTQLGGCVLYYYMYGPGILSIRHSSSKYKTTSVQNVKLDSTSLHPPFKKCPHTHAGSSMTMKMHENRFFPINVSLTISLIQRSENWKQFHAAKGIWYDVYTFSLDWHYKSANCKPFESWVKNCMITWREICSYYILYTSVREIKWEDSWLQQGGYIFSYHAWRLHACIILNKRLKSIQRYHGPQKIHALLCIERFSVSSKYSHIGLSQGVGMGQGCTSAKVQQLHQTGIFLFQPFHKGLERLLWITQMRELHLLRQLWDKARPNGHGLFWSWFRRLHFCLDG